MRIDDPTDIAVDLGWGKVPAQARRARVRRWHKPFMVKVVCGSVEAEVANAHALDCGVGR
jgi:hypothetical protein